MYGLNRYVCDVLREMRTCHETRNYTYLPSLIEEAQVLVNRMEAALHDTKDLKHLHAEIKKKKKELEELQEVVEEEE
jgi:hypothetical protein